MDVCIISDYNQRGKIRYFIQRIMPQRSDPDTLKIPAYMRNKAIVKRDRQRLLWTAWDRKEAGVKPNSPRALGKVDRSASTVPLVPGRTRLSNTQKTSRASVVMSGLTTKTPAYMLQGGAKSIPVVRGGLNSSHLLESGCLHAKPAHMRAKPARPLESVGSESEMVSPIKFAGRQRFVRAGEITDYLDRIGVAIIKTTRPLKSGDILLVEGEECVFTQPVDGMQIDRKPVKRAKKGVHIGLKVGEKAVAGGSVYLLDL